MSIFDINDDLFASTTEPEDIEHAIAILSEPYSKKRQVTDTYTWEEFEAGYRSVFPERNGFLFKNAEGAVVGIATFEALLPSLTSACIHGAIKREFWGKGYAKEIMDFIKEYLFSIPEINKIEITEPIPNLSISHLAKSNGFKLEASIANRGLVNGRLTPMKIYGITREDYENGSV